GAREGEWRGGPDRSGDLEHLWVRRKNPAEKVFRRWSPAASGGGRLAAAGGAAGKAATVAAVAVTVAVLVVSSGGEAAGWVGGVACRGSDN
nr:hypothetical protein [Tanacetum cinerariifolium]